MKNLLCLSLVACLAACALGQSTAEVSFKEIPGEMEFSGRLIARPKQVQDQLNAGVPYHLAVTVHNVARRYARPLSGDYILATDEYILDVPQGKTETQVAAEMMATGAFQYVEPD